MIKIDLHDLSILIAAQYENCQCSSFKQCTWSRNQLEKIERLSKNSRRGQFKYFRDRICDFKSQKVYCCKDQTAPRTNGHIEYLKKKSLGESSRSASSGTCISIGYTACPREVVPRGGHLKLMDYKLIQAVGTTL